MGPTIHTIKVVYIGFFKQSVIEAGLPWGRLP